MDILGIGPLELFFIIVIALIVLGPKDMVKAGRTIGKNLKKVVSSENWRTIQQASNEIRTLPNRLMREAGLDEIQKDLKTTADDLKAAVPKDLDIPKIDPLKFNLDEWTKSPNIIAPEAKALEETQVEPPPAEPSDAPEQS
jgi:sec-independent protein translocase protein TatB